MPMDDEAAPVGEAGAARRSVPISALEHYEYCSRQAALIHVEGYFASNTDTVRGDLAHAAVDQPGSGSDHRRGRLWRALPVWHDDLGMHGVCDVVQFTAEGPLPVEHKSGRYRAGGPADLQVGAQVLCLREMFGSEVPKGLVFSGRDRRRHEVIVDAALESRVRVAIRDMRALYNTAALPAPVNDQRCRRCSLAEGCLPAADTTAQNLFGPRSEGHWND
jgi:CRISPR-associated exonuclease Cas4